MAQLTSVPLQAPAAGRPAPSRTALASPRRAVSRAAVLVVLAVVVVLFVAPLVWLVLSSLNTTAALSLEAPEALSLDNFAAVLTWETAGRPLLNSVVLSGGAAIVTVVAAVLAAYPLSRYQLRFGKTFMYGILFGSGLPITAMMVPVYSLFVQLNLLDSMTGTIFFMAATSLPMAIWMTKNFMDSVPVSLEEAAWVDGASAMRTLRSIVVPLMRPGIAVVFIFTFIQAWGNFFVPFILLLSPDKRPAAVSIFSFFGQYGSVAYGQLAAYSLVYAAPVIFLYIFVTRVLGGSFAGNGALKG